MGGVTAGTRGSISPYAVFDRASWRALAEGTRLPLDEAELRGLAGARADLFAGRPWFLEHHHPAVTTMIASAGSEAVIVDAEEHDISVALTSHLPQLVSTALAFGVMCSTVFALGRGAGGLFFEFGLKSVIAFFVGAGIAWAQRTGAYVIEDDYDSEYRFDIAPISPLQALDGASSVYHPGRSARLCLGPKNALAEFGELHPAALKAFDLDGPVVAAEIFLDALPRKRGGIGHMRTAYAPPALQAVKRDFAFLLPADTEAEQLLRAVRGADKTAIVEARLFDVFTGQGVPEGEKSLAIEVTLQPGEKSFTDEELKAISERIVAAASKAGARLRD